MSNITIYNVRGEILIDDGILSRLKITCGERFRIRELKELGDDVITASQLRELEGLIKGSMEKTIVYNGITITTKKPEDEEAALYVDLNQKTGFIPGYKKNDMTFKYSEKKGGLILKNSCFHDKDNIHFNLVTDVIEAVRAEAKIKKRKEWKWLKICANFIQKNIRI